MRKAVHLYKEFHQFEPRKIGPFPKSFTVPHQAVCVGEALEVLYRSDKLNPTTHEDEGMIDYIHEHDPGVRAYRTDQGADGPVRQVPKFIWGSKELVLLGSCLGYAYLDSEGDEIEAKVRTPYPELYSIPSGRALLVVQDKKKVLALIWGGRLGVEDRGIVY